LGADHARGRAAVADLAALGYGAFDDSDAVSEVAPPRVARVHKAAAVAPGWTLYADDIQSVVAVDIEGAVQRAWTIPGHTQVEYARLLEGGRVLALSVDEGLTLLEPDGGLVWQLALACHHDVAVRPGDPPGQRTFAVATHTLRDYGGRRVRFDEVRWVDEASGAVVEAPFPSLDSFELQRLWAAPYAATGARHPLDRPAPSGVALQEAADPQEYDYFHLNSLEWERGDDGAESLLICLRNVDTVASVRLPDGSLLWHADPRELDWPHMPRRVRGEGARNHGGPASGDVLVFDNGRHRGWSRLVAFDAAGRATWSWEADPRQCFFSEVRGAVQELGNGNLLVTESERGRVFELDPHGECVWEYWNPRRRGAAVRRIYRAERYPEAAFEAAAEASQKR